MSSTSTTGGPAATNEYPHLTEKITKPANGYMMLAVVFVWPLLPVLLFWIASALQSGPSFLFVILGFIAVIAWFIGLAGFMMVAPREARVLQLFGEYVGTAVEPGLKYVNPFYSKTKVSLRLRNFESGRLKVNDSEGNPVEIATIVVWRVVDTAEALFNIDDFVQFVRTQTESAVRALAAEYPYDTHEDGQPSLRESTDDLARQLQARIQQRLEKAGIEVMEARISHLAYAAEIAAAMLQRQQASAIVAARQQIVDGAVGMVEHALRDLEDKGIVQLAPMSRAQIVGNLLVVLCSHQAAQPVINTSSTSSEGQPARMGNVMADEGEAEEGEEA